MELSGPIVNGGSIKVFGKARDGVAWKAPVAWGKGKSGCTCGGGGAGGARDVFIMRLLVSRAVVVSKHEKLGKKGRQNKRHEEGRQVIARYRYKYIYIYIYRYRYRKRSKNDTLTNSNLQS